VFSREERYHSQGDGSPPFILSGELKQEGCEILGVDAEFVSFNPPLLAVRTSCLRNTCLSATQQLLCSDDATVFAKAIS
jgi:hypothetical protein